MEQRSLFGFSLHKSSKNKEDARDKESVEETQQHLVSSIVSGTASTMLDAGSSSILVACAIEVSGPELELVGPSLLSARSVIRSEYPTIASNSSSSFRGS